ncbi:MAG TPA: hypothetical protein DDZ90_24925 [Planctomycetaceae bacterium]|nr:hypothetical protein [Gimesia sp.]HBL46634.1 hypothetical protein [Planctomycetaceae bacterium]|tara:strand:- start:11630 stop:11905 length:276 start_codon:yes stop_codon:yes gene_type:complete
MDDRGFKNFKITKLNGHRKCRLTQIIIVVSMQKINLNISGRKPSPEPTPPKKIRLLSMGEDKNINHFFIPDNHMSLCLKSMPDVLNFVSVN